MPSHSQLILWGVLMAAVLATTEEIVVGLAIVGIALWVALSRPHLPTGILSGGTITLAVIPNDSALRPASYVLHLTNRSGRYAVPCVQGLLEYMVSGPFESLRAALSHVEGRL
jgi:hypothetical protein